MRLMILFSIVLSQVYPYLLCSRRAIAELVCVQIGFVAAYTIFVVRDLLSTLLVTQELTRIHSQAQNLQAFFMAVTNCKTLIPLPFLIVVQVVVFLRTSPLPAP